MITSKQTGKTDPSIGRVRFNFTKSFWLWGMMTPTIFFGAQSVSLKLCIITLILTFFGICLGHSVGLHRCLIHQSFQCGSFLRGLLAWLSVLAGLGGPITWARIHGVRDYWQNRLDCPPYFAYKHSMFKDFIWNLHLSFHPADNRADEKLPPHLLTDPWLNFLEKTWPLHHLAIASIIYLTLGAEGVVICVCSRITGGILGHWAIGYASHAWGEQPHRQEGASEHGTNNWLLGVLSFGEGFHNNHHAYPQSARMGLAPLDFDLGWWVVLLLKRLNLIHSVKCAGRGEVVLGNASARIRIPS